MSVDGIDKGVPAGSVQFRVESGSPANGRGHKAQPAGRADQLNLSEKSIEFFRIRQLVDQLPDVRLEKVNQLAKAIDEGTYNVTGEQIAEALIQKHLVDFDA
ncbi:MAG: flagellar biosynthesis anti-sigma factor FlgM [Acidobacteriota bacterium]